MSNKSNSPTDTKVGTINVLNNSKRGLVHGNLRNDTAFRLAPGATELPADIFDRVMNSDTPSGESLRHDLKVGTIAMIDCDTTPMDQVAKRIAAAVDDDELVRIVCKDGRDETRARASQRRWLMGAPGSDIITSAETRCYFNELDQRMSEPSPSDEIYGWRRFHVPQRHGDNLLKIMSRQAAERKKFEERLAVVAAMANGKVSS